ncbi:cytochrome P450 [Cylindrobasidium torrendii FP15055 ss-10]|uniref:Cytochrome P450 n=1 Tax=Cylindrobasidium torrendii FP15055 ss-10 TaxID=1314674 RepID=A0A0D7BIA9_9AGAR|nr:cytochrome P450 [Cylindrobasidium torrendii FP15055 ss-10]
MFNLGNTIVSSVLALALLIFFRWQPWRSSSIPSYGAWYLPPFVRGIQAIIALGSNEDAFLLALRQKYGPIVYLPWPLGIIFLLTPRAIANYYLVPSKQFNFSHFRLMSTQLLFGLPPQRDANIWFDRIFPVHARGMKKNRLTEPMQRFHEVFARKVAMLKDQVEESPNGFVDVSIQEWLLDALFDAGLAAMFGHEFLHRVTDSTGTTQQFYHHFKTVDDAFMLKASGFVPSVLEPIVTPLRNAQTSNTVILGIFKQFVLDGTPGLDEGLIKEVAEAIMKEETLNADDAAGSINGTFWALQANAPLSCVSLFYRALQSPTLIDELRAEVEAGGVLPIGVMGEVNQAALSDSTPLMTSTVNETLRLDTTSSSIRFILTDVPFDVSEDPSKPNVVVVPKGSRMVAPIRQIHIDDKDTWGDDALMWDPYRFFRKTEDGKDRERLQAMRAFGGGVSICEGRHLAMVELKTALACFLSVFDAKVQVDDEGTLERVRLAGVEEAWSPPKDGTRQGAGAYHYTRDMTFRVSLRT